MSLSLALFNTEFMHTPKRHWVEKNKKQYSTKIISTDDAYVSHFV